MITLDGLTKRYRAARGPVKRSALAPMTAEFRDGEVTYLLGPNGAGKSTLIRLLAGLSTPTAGTVLIDGLAPGKHADPLRTIGITVDSHSFNPRNTANQHLSWLAKAGGIEKSRIAEVLHLVGLDSVGNLCIGSYSLGMQQRLTIACALLGNPQNIVLDEPLNGLDVDGIMWARELFCELARQGHCIVVSTHLLPEVARTGDHILVMGGGEVLSDSTLVELVNSGSDGTITPAGVTHGIELADRLEQRYVELTSQAVEYTAGGSK